MNKQDECHNPLSQDFSFYSLLKFALPTIMSMLLMGIYTIMDTIFVSQFVNSYALSALNIVCPIINIIVGLATMIATGGNAIIAKKMGSGNIQRARQDLTLLVLLGVVIGLIITILGIVFLDEIVMGLGASQLLKGYCEDYLFVLLFFTPASLLQVIFQNMIVTAGKPKAGLGLSISAGLVNIIFDYFFMVSMNMGIKGAALGTGMGYLVVTIAGLLLLGSRQSLLRFAKPVMDFSVIIQSCCNGASEMVSQLSAAITTYFFNMTMMQLAGEEGVAAITILIYMQFFMTTLYIGFSMGVAPIISFHYGANNQERLKVIYHYCLRFIVVSSLVIFLIAIIGNPWFIGLFVNEHSEVYMKTTQGFYIFALSFLFSGMNIFSSATFTALSNGKISAMISFLRTFGLIMLGLMILPRMIQITGVWLVIPIAELLTLGISIFFLISYKKQYGYL